MIVTVILYMVYGLIVAITSPLRLFPDVSIDSNIVTTMASVKSSLGVANEILPITTVLIVLGVILSFELILFSYKGIMWVIKKIPGIG